MAEARALCWDEKELFFIDIRLRRSLNSEWTIVLESES